MKQMAKLKTKKTLTKRIKVTKNGKLMRKQNRMGHLKIKMDSSRKLRKRQLSRIMNKKVAKRLLQLLRI